jgi:hypothetical protein
VSSETNARQLLLPVGLNGRQVIVPESIDFAPPAKPVEQKPALSSSEQQAIVESAINHPQSGAPLKELAKGHRRVCVIVGDLSLPAPYWLALPPIVAALVEVDIRPTRISFVAYPNASSLILGRAAIHRYGEDIVGDHELRAWQAAEGETDQLYSSADLKIAVLPSHADLQLAVDATVRLKLGNKAVIDIESVQYCSGSPPAANPKSKIENPKSSDVWLTSGGGAEWETSLEEATISLHSPREASTAVLAFGGEEGLGSSRFARDLWSMLEEAENVLQSNSALPSPPGETPFDPASAFAAALANFERLVLFSEQFATHPEGEDLLDRMSAWPKISQRLHLIGGEAQLWELLKRSHGESFKLTAEPLGWRAQIKP